MGQGRPPPPPTECPRTGLRQRRSGIPGHIPPWSCGDGVIVDSIESVHPAVNFFLTMGLGLLSCIFWLSTVFGNFDFGNFRSL